MSPLGGSDRPSRDLQGFFNLSLGPSGRLGAEMTDSRTRRAAKEAGASLVGTLVVLAILGVLATLAARSVTSSDNSLDLRPEVGPGDPSTASTSASGRRVSPAAAATLLACQLDERSVESAVAGMHAAVGRYPGTMTELVAGGWLTEPPASGRSTFTLETGSGGPTGRVLVNGHPGAEACALGGGS
jgi:hypothetical protein